MSGGHFDYKNDYVCNEIFGWDVDPCYGLGREEHMRGVTIAKAVNPMEDKLLSELVYDVFCLLHSLDWYKSADTSEETYRKDVDYFKRKWFDASVNDLVTREIDDAVEELRNELRKTLLWGGESECCLPEE